MRKRKRLRGKLRVNLTCHDLRIPPVTACYSSDFSANYQKGEGNGERFCSDSGQQYLEEGQLLGLSSGLHEGEVRVGLRT